MEDKSLLNDAFNMYYAKAKEEHAAGNTALAKRNYLLAAETLMKAAKTSSKSLQRAQFDRAKRLAEIAENLQAPHRRRAAAGDGGAGAGAGTGAGADGEEAEKTFAAAEIPDISFADIAGLDEVKKAITVRMINPIKHPEKYALYGKKTGGGVLLYGPPGTGKTMIAKAIAHEAGARFYAIKGSDIVSKWVGDSEKNINALFEQARKDARSIIFIDEMDSLFGSRGSDTHNDRRVNEFLQQIDGFAGKNPNMLLLGATNRPWDVDSAAVRSGRFSQKIYIPLPDAKARLFLFKLYTKDAPLEQGVDLGELVRFTENYSGADIAEVCDRAKEEPLEKYISSGEVVKIRQLDLLKAVKAVAPMIDAAELARFERYAGVKRGQTGTGTGTGTERTPDTAETDGGAGTAAGEAAKDGGANANAGETKTDGGANARADETAKDGGVRVFLESDTLKLLPDVKPRIEFALSKSFEKIYLLFDTQHYTCAKKINNYVSDEINVTEPGEYTVGVLAGSEKVADFKIKAVKGMQENNFDL